MKYIIFQDFSGKAVPFIFPERVEHMDMREQMPYARVLSAGYVSLVDGGFVCSGADAELGVGASGDDAAIISSFFTRERE